MKAGDLLSLKQPTTRMMRKYQGELFVVVRSNGDWPRATVQSLKTGKRRRLSKKRFEVISESR